jgi:hypothetical protein
LLKKGNSSGKVEPSESPLGFSVLSINEQMSSQKSEVIEKVEEKSAEKTKVDLDRTNDIDLNQNIPQEKKNLADIIKNKLLKINTISLCTDFINYLDLDKFCEFCEEYMKIKVFKHSLEKVKIPAFRNVTKNSFDNVDAWKKRQSIISKSNPKIKSNTRFYLIVGLLVCVGVLVIIFLILLLTK